MKSRGNALENVRVLQFSEEPPESFLRAVIDMMKSHCEEIKLGTQLERKEKIQCQTQRANPEARDQRKEAKNE